MANKNTIKIAIAGASGRMGQALIQAVEANPKLELSGAWDKKDSRAVGQDAGTFAGTSSAGVVVLDDAASAMAGADVAVDFTTPEATMLHLKAAEKTKTALVVGTTGLSKSQLEKIKEFSKKRPVVLSSNFSIGVTVLAKAAALVAAATGDDYDVEIVDVHHRHKKDSPSGTAVTLLGTIAAARGKNPDKVAVYGRKGLHGARARGEIGVHALRAGDVVGDHTIFFAGEYERIELVHRSHARGNFANGALKAAAWIIAGKKASGQYTMAQVLGLEK